MAVLETPSGILVEGDTYKDGMRMVEVARAPGYATSGITGTMAAALAINSTVFAMRLDPGATRQALIQRVRIQWTTVVAFTVPITAGRRLALFRGSGAATTGGTSIATAVPKDSDNPSSEFNLANGGDIRISTTAALGVAGITYETDPLQLTTLTHVGAAGAHFEAILDPDEGEPLTLNPGQLLAVRNPVAMDAAGTWTLGVNIQWIEGDGL